MKTKLLKKLRDESVRNYRLVLTDNRIYLICRDVTRINSVIFTTRDYTEALNKLYELRDNWIRNIIKKMQFKRLQDSVYND